MSFLKPVLDHRTSTTARECPEMKTIFWHKPTPLPRTLLQAKWKRKGHSLESSCLLPFPVFRSADNFSRWDASVETLVSSSLLPCNKDRNACSKALWRKEPPSISSLCLSILYVLYLPITPSPRTSPSSQLRVQEESENIVLNPSRYLGCIGNATAVPWTFVELP